jgi:HEPN domain-containing protein
MQQFSINQEYIAAEMFRRVEEAFPSMTEETMDLAMRMISKKLQGHNLGGFLEEAKLKGEGVALLSRGAQLAESFAQHGGLDTLQEAVDMLRRALALFPPGQRHRGIALNNLANALMMQYEQDGDTSKLAESVNQHREALFLHPRGHPDRAMSLSNLANALMTQYKQDGNMSKLAQLVTQHREALSLRPEGHPDRASSLSNLAGAVMRQYEQDGDASKLAETVDLIRKALLLHPPGHRDRPISLNNLANALMTQYEQDGDTSKLTEMVDRYREALSLKPQGHPGRASSLNNLADALKTQYEQDGDTSKLAEAVNLHHKVLLLHPQGHPDHAGSLSNLANALMAQYGRNGDMLKLADAVDLYCKALSLRPKGHPNRGDSLNNLAKSHLIQYECDGNKSALINALKLWRECLDSRIPGHPNQHSVHHSIAQLQLMDSLLFNWTEALNHLMQAMKDNSAAPRRRLRQSIQSLRLVELTSFRDSKHFFYSQQALDVYIKAIHLLPRAAHAGLDVSARLRELSGSEQLCRAAAMRAMLLNQLPTTVEVFEEGKAVFWSQALRLRSTALDELQTADGERLGHLFRELDSEYADSSIAGLEKADLERHIEHRRQLNDEAESLIAKIRHRPGFKRFLRIPQYEQLAQAASNGFVVALVANEPNYFAIIIQAGKDPQPISLTFVDSKKLRRLTELTSDSGMRDFADERVTRQKLHPRMPLEQIWLTIVKPVLLYLGLQVRHNRLI